MLTTGIHLVLYEPLYFGVEHAIEAAQLVLHSGLKLAYTRLNHTESGQYLRVICEDTPENLVRANLKTVEARTNRALFEQDITFYAVSNLKYPFIETVRANEIDFVFSFRIFSGSTRVIEGYVGNVGGDKRTPAAHLLLTIGQLFFERFRPIYGWLDFDYKSHPTALKKTLRTRRIQELYWATFFNTEYVEQYGQYYFFNAPVWRAVNVAESGVLLQLGPDIAPARQDAVNVEQVISYFRDAGLKYIAWPKNIWVKKTN